MYIKKYDNKQRILPMSFLENGVTGHRGDPQHFPQNTLAGFEAAIHLKCDWVETDLHLTRDNRLVLSHDSDTRNEGDQCRIIRETDFDELRKINIATRFNMTYYDKPGRFDVMPTLEETLELFRSQDKVRLSLQPKAPGTVEAAAKIIRDMNFPPEMLGFNDGNLEYMISARENFPEATIFYDRYYEKGWQKSLPEDIAVSLRHNFQALVIFEQHLTREGVDMILNANLQPGVWNINNPGEMDRFIAMNVKRFYTDFPAVLLKKLNHI